LSGFWEVALKKLVIVSALAALWAGASHASDFDIQVDNFSKDFGITSVVMKISNNLGYDVKNVYIDCVFLTKEKRAIDIGPAIVSKIAAGSYAYEKAAITKTDGVRFVECSVKDFSR
jgi:hypothetical protein